MKKTLAIIFIIILTICNASCRSNTSRIIITDNIDSVINVYPSGQVLTAPKRVDLEDTIDLVPTVMR
jgi:hypothetical protein